MKRIVYIATMVALLASSCQKTDVLNVVEDTIEFGTQVGKLTKADAKDYSDNKYATLKTQGFRVWTVADFTLGNDTDGAIYRGMNNLKVIYTTSWGYDPTQTSQKYFWPAANNYLYFYTLSAKDATWLDGINYATHFTKENIAADGQEQVIEVTKLNLPTFTVTAAADDDVMVADHIYQHKADPTNGKVVKPTFRHTMTKVEFNFKQGTVGTEATSATEAATVILVGVEIGGYVETAERLVCKGDLDVTYGFNNASNTTPFKWTPSTDIKDVLAFASKPTELYTIVKKGGDIIPVREVAPAPAEANDLYVEEYASERKIMKYDGTTWVLDETHTKANGVWTAARTDGKSAVYETLSGKKLETGDDYYNCATWYMIPQPLGSKTVRISYVADGTPLAQEFKLSGTDTQPITWDEEKCVKYNVTIAPHKIDFSPSVEGWKVYDSDSTTAGDQDINMNN